MRKTKYLMLIVALYLTKYTNAQIILNSDINVASQRSVDGKQYHVIGNKHYPYKDTANFLSTIPKTRRHVGEIAYIFNSDSSFVNVWQFVGGIENSNLINVTDKFYKKNEVDSIVDANMIKDITWGVIDSIRNAPASPEQGDRYLVSTSATGAFTGRQNLIATYDTTAGWSFQNAAAGDLLYNSTSYKTYKWTGVTWELRPPPLVENWWSRTAWNGAPGQYIQTGAKNNYLTMFGSLNGSSVGLGRQVFTSNPQGGSGNTAIGSTSQYHNEYGGYNNTSVGNYSYWYNTRGHDNIAIGSNIIGNYGLNTSTYGITLGSGTFVWDRTLTISDSTTKMQMKLDTTGTAPKWMIGRNDNGYWNSYRLSNIVADGGSGIFIPLSEKGQPNGVPDLDGTGKVPLAQLPAITTNTPTYVQTLVQMLAQSSVVGDLTVVADSSKTYALTQLPANQFSNWIELKAPLPTSTDQLPEGVNNKYYTDTRVRNTISGTGRITYNNSNGQIGVTAPDWSTPGDILNKPTIPVELTPVSGDNIFITGTYPALKWDVTGIYTKTQSDSISTKIRGEVADSMQSVAHLYPDMPGYKKFESIGLLFPNHVRMNSGLALYGTMDASSGSILAGDITSTNYKLSPIAISFHTTDSLPHGNKVLTLDETTGDFKYGTIPTSIGINDGLSTDSTTYSSDKINSLIADAGGGDMLKSVYDPTNVNGDAFDYNNLHNKPTLELNTILHNNNAADTGIYLRSGKKKIELDVDFPSLQLVDSNLTGNSPFAVDLQTWGLHWLTPNSSNKFLYYGEQLPPGTNLFTYLPKKPALSGNYPGGNYYIPLGAKINGSTIFAANDGIIDLGTISGGSGSNNPDSLAGYKGLDYLRKDEATALYEPIISTKNTAFNKNFGTSAGTVSEGNHTHAFSSITSKPTTLSGYGITDGITKSQLMDSLNARMQGDTVAVNTPLHIKHGAKDTLYMTQASTTDSGWVSKEQVNSWNGKIGGTVGSGQVAFGDGSGLSGDNGLFWDNTNKRLGVGTITPSEKLDVVGNAKVSGTLKVGAYTLPSTDGTSGQVLQTNGSGVVTWQTVSGGGGTANLALGTATSTTQPITNSNGTGVTLPSATTTTAGLLSAADKTKLNGALSRLNVINSSGNRTIQASDIGGYIVTTYGGNTAGTTFTIPTSASLSGLQVGDQITIFQIDAYTTTIVPASNVYLRTPQGRLNKIYGTNGTVTLVYIGSETWTIAGDLAFIPDGGTSNDFSLQGIMYSDPSGGSTTLTANVTGGTAPYGYTWTKVAGGSATITSPNASSTTVTGLTTGTYSFKCVATDAASHSDSKTVFINVP